MAYKIGSRGSGPSKGQAVSNLGKGIAGLAEPLGELSARRKKKKGDKKAAEVGAGVATSLATQYLGSFMRGGR